jgi:TonB family protein
MMVAQWMVESLALALLLGLAAAALERVLRRWRRETRWVWSAALVLAGVLPLLPLPARTTTVVGGGGVRVEPISAEFVRGAMGALPEVLEPSRLGAAATFGTVLAVLWLFASTCVLLYLVISHLRLRRLSREWTVEEVDGVRVWISEDVGPAAFGVRSRGVVLPRWALTLEGRKRALTIEHELEHQRAGDVRHWLLGLAVLVALPWNPTVWWKLRRLRMAIEVDCDRRVLRRSRDVGLYGALLIEMAGRSRCVPLAAAAFASRRSEVEERVREMTRSVSRFRAPLTAIGSAAALALLLAACHLSRPVVEVAAAGDQPGTSTEPVTGPAPSALARTIQLPPPPATSTGVGPTPPPDWTPLVTPTASLIPAPSGAAAGATPDIAPPDDDLRELAMRLAETRIRAAQRQEPADTPVAPAARPDLADQPVFTPMEARPFMTNTAEFQRELEAMYPPMLKDAGIGGTATLWVFIDETGRVAQTRVYRSSGYEQLDGAAERLLREVATFRPAQNRDSPVPVWVQMNVTFQSR